MGNYCFVSHMFYRYFSSLISFLTSLLFLCSQIYKYFTSKSGLHRVYKSFPNFEFKKNHFSFHFLNSKDDSLIFGDTNFYRASLLLSGSITKVPYIPLY